MAGVFAHIGFWDARAIFWLDEWGRGVEPSAPDYQTREDVEWINNSAKPLCLAILPRDAPQLALRLAEEADPRVEALTDEILAKIREAGSPFDLSRAAHRKEHLDDIERVLGVSAERHLRSQKPTQAEGDAEMKLRLVHYDDIRKMVHLTPRRDILIS